MNIEFPNHEAYGFDTDTVNFIADVDANRIVCRISKVALEDNFGGIGIEILDAFRASRSIIESKANDLINEGRYESDGSILIRSSDGT